MAQACDYLAWPATAAAPSHRHPRWRWRILLLWLLPLLVGFPRWAQAQDATGLTMGVFASRDKEVMRRRFTPLAEYLSQSLHMPVQLAVLDLSEIAQALRQHRLDLLLTTPIHYEVLRSTNTLTGALATLVSLDHNAPVSALGGVIVARAGRSDINALADLASLGPGRIAAPGKGFLGAYQAQMMELAEANVTLQDAQFKFDGNQDTVAQSVLKGRVDVGFMRTGELESMARAGQLKLSDFKIIHDQALPSFPFALSTRLYPEWPVLALPHVDAVVARRVASVLLGMEPNHPALRAAELYGFSIAADYLPVEHLARTLRLPPFDHTPEFTLSDVVARHRITLLTAGVLLVALLGLTLWLARTSQRLHLSLAQLRANVPALQLAASVFTHAQEGIMITDSEARLVNVNESFTRITGYTPEEVLGRNPAMLRSGRHASTFYENMWADLHNDGQWSGELWNRRKDGELYAAAMTITSLRDPAQRLLHHVAVFSDVTAQKEHERELEFAAHFDALTRLPNRALLADRMQQALARAQRRGGPVAVVYLDLDRFKQINDSHGHDVGDHLLQTVAKRLKDALREGDTLARMGGDEFVAVLTDVDDKAGCERVLQRLLNAASAPMNLRDDGLAQAQLTASLGVALFPKDGVEPDILLRQADQAMYLAKQTGKNRAHFFDSGEDEAARQRNGHIDRVAQALIDREFVLYYQPKVNMRSGEVVGAEALIRWQHPEQGLLGPGQFLPGIEGHAVSVSVGQWVMETAMSQMAAWKAQGLHLPVSVNISAHHLQQDDFALQLEALLARYPHVPPHCLKLEVLETSALDDMTWVAEVMQACSKLGVAFSLDDFGTGYSSLTYLKRLPAHELKIDQSFVRDMLQNPEDLAIVEGVIGLSNAFGRSVIAEGVETEDHGVLLLRLGCELAQGYGVARPMAAEHIGAWIQSWQPPPAWRALAAHTPHRADQPLIFAEVEHRHWVRQIELSMVNGLPAPPMNVHECRFGKALDRLLKDPRFNRRAEAGHLVELHEATHLAAARLMAHVQRGEHAQTAEALAQLHAATDALVLQLRTMCEV